ncbi:translation elongation factor Ts [Flexithrix dorotheae]|uniref:translation elongation factor Ts n=1 Tax=Flexithrix dorotheae TaxID=70993 RepID=UPI00036991E6|nr:translation elongation factor Ts [Flexithrix dorotheae]
MAITAKQVNELRQATGAGMMDCKNALVEAGGDLEKAVDILRKKGQKVAAKRADKEASEGNAYTYVSDDKSEGIAVTLNCETEPVSNTDEFQSLGKLIIDAAVANKPASKEDLLNLQVEGKAVSEYMVELSGKIGEKIEVSNYAYIKGEQVVAYLHGRSIAVLVNLSNTEGEDFEAVGKDIAMQIAAMKPIAVNEDGIDPAVVEREKQVGIEKAKEEGKPEHILERIAEGFVKKFYKENTLLSQEFVKDSKVNVQQYLTSVKKGLTVKEFVRVGIGR